ncbi:MAG: TRAP transporter large permease subunit, partial [Acidimicrobiia bacterium]|nr:TRAP transporter large permease subunit [Acidimicrobiia bacterium]
MIAAQIVQILGLDLGVFLAISMFVVFMVLILSGYNVAFCFASTALAFAFIGHMSNTISINTFDPGTLSGQLPPNWATSIRSQELLAVPLFVLMGAILERSGLAERLLNAFGLLMGSLRGGVAAAVIVVGTLLAAATGVVAATVIVMGLLSLPTMVKLGYDHKLATGAITASGTLAQMLPPSIVLILLAGELGVGIIGLFAGALMPGLLLSGLYIIYTLGISLIKPEVGPVMDPEDRKLEGKPTFRSAVIIGTALAVVVFLVGLLLSLEIAVIGAAAVFLASVVIVSAGNMLVAEILVSIVPVLVLIAGVLTSIFSGTATPSESGAVGVLGALILSGLNHLFDRVLTNNGAKHIRPGWKLNVPALRDAARSTANITVLVMTLLFCSLFFRLMFQELGGSAQVAEWLSSIPGGKLGFVVVAMVAVFLLGINLEFLEITFIVVPIFVPAMQLLEFTDQEIVWFAVLMAVNLNMAFISPPVGFSLFYLQSVAPPEVKTADIHKGALPFMGLQIIALFILGFVPGITNFSYCFFNPNAPSQLCEGETIDEAVDDGDEAFNGLVL